VQGQFSSRLLSSSVDSHQDGKPIIGNRWKCTMCEDFDLCDKCHTSKIHEAHEMQLIPKPAESEAKPDEPKGPTHENVACDACAVSTPKYLLFPLVDASTPEREIYRRNALEVSDMRQLRPL
jgi:hypothetical protein